jgi:hypothetical protein
VEEIMTIRSPWQVAANELALLRGSGGERFTEFVDALLRAEAALLGTKPDDVVTNIRVNIGDGGVDSEVKVPLAGRNGFETPTCWQYKATDFADVSDADLEREVAKVRSTRRVKEGYSYCVCVCDDSTAEKKDQRLAALKKAVQAVNVSAPSPRFLGASELAEWANRFPSVVLRFFRPAMTIAVTYERWREMECVDLPNYWKVPARRQISEQITHHVDFSNASSPVLTVAGPTGTGKSRLVLESLANVARLVMYTPDGPHVIQLLTAVVNDPMSTSVLVVDGCSMETRRVISKLLAGVATRLRAISIADSAESPPKASLTVNALEDDETAEVLNANFPNVPTTHRRAIVQLAGGVLRVAATLAREYQPGTSTFLDAAIRTENDSLQLLVPDARDMTALEAISLFTRVGYQGKVAKQLQDVARVLSLDAADLLARCRRVAVSPGLAAVGHRYISVRPPFFSRVLLARAWQRWTDEQPARVLEQIPAELLRPLLEQVAAHASVEMRDQVAAWGATWARKLQPKDLQRAEVVSLLLPLVEVHPRRLGPHLTGLVCRATIEELQSPGEPFRHWPTRMHLLWCLEKKLLARRDTYQQAEAALFRMALAEGDAGRKDTSSATIKWASSFRVVLSGTETSFAERMTILRKHFASSESIARQLVLVAIDRVLDPHHWRIAGPPLVAGELRPVEWQPKTNLEWCDCLRSALNLLGDALLVPDQRTDAMRILVKHGRGLLTAGLVGDFKKLIAALELDETEYVLVIKFITNFLDYECERNAKERPPRDYIDQVLAWRQELVRSDLGYRVASLLGATSLKKQLDAKEEWLDEM